MQLWKIGFGKTGTTSLHKALLRMDVRSCHDNKKCDQAARAAARGGRHALLRQFDAFTDGEEAQRSYKNIYHWNPEAKFILTVRDVEHWIDSKVMSVMHHRATKPSQAHELDVDTYALRYEFEKHTKDVQDFFDDKPGSLLVFNCCDGNDGYKELATFLNLSAPHGAWPVSNPSFTKIKAIQQRLVKRASGK